MKYPVHYRRQRLIVGILCEGLTQESAIMGVIDHCFTFFTCLNNFRSWITLNTELFISKIVKNALDNIYLQHRSRTYTRLYLYHFLSFPNISFPLGFAFFSNTK